MQLIATTLEGLEPVLAQELINLGFTNIEKSKRAVYFDGGDYQLYTANHKLRTALKVIKPFESFYASNIDQYYRNLYKIPWSNIIDLKQTFAIKTTGRSELFSNAQFCAYKTKDAIVDHFKDRFEKRPNVDTKNPEIPIVVHMNKDKFIISLDSTGASLHKRGYRANATKAPLNEALAAGIVLLSGWNGDTVFMDPMCGSGTLLVEAAKIALDIPPQSEDRSYAFMNWKSFNSSLWDKVILENRIKLGSRSIKLVGFDIDKKSIYNARDAVYQEELQDYVKVYNKDFFELENDFEHVQLVFNPPYDKRISSVDPISFYKKIGDHLKQNFQGTDAWLFSGNIDALKNIGLKTSRRFHLLNAQIPSKLHKFELYQGTKKHV